MKGRVSVPAQLLKHAPVLLLSALYLYACGITAAHQPLWIDEIFTYDVASLDSPTSILNALLAKMDNHPPLDYIVRHYSMMLMGPSEFALRLPSILALLLAQLSIYVFVYRRTSTAPALVAFSLPFSTIALEYGYEGRGYALLMASMGLALLAWQLVAERPTPVRWLFFTVALAAGPFVHFYGVLNFAPIVAGETWRCWTRKRISWATVAGIGVSLVALIPLIPFATHASEYSDTFWTKHNLSLIANSYTASFDMTIPAIIGSLIVAACLAIFARERPASATPPEAIPTHETVSATVLSLLPFITYALALLLTKVFGVRYTLNMIFGVSILAAYSVYWLSWRRKIAASLISAGFAAWAAVILIHLASSVPTGPAIPEIDKKLFETSSSPVVIADGQLFMKYQHYLDPAQKKKIVYLSDRSFSLQYRGSDTADRAFKNLSRFVPLNVSDLCTFLDRNREFLLLSYKTSWLVEMLSANGASLRIRDANSDGRTVLLVELSGAPAGCGQKRP
jgi:uncharacterized membrane protein